VILGGKWRSEQRSCSSYRELSRAKLPIGSSVLIAVDVCEEVEPKESLVKGRFAISPVEIGRIWICRWSGVDILSEERCCVVCEIVDSDAICQRIRPRDRVGALADEHAGTGTHGWLVRFLYGCSWVMVMVSGAVKGWVTTLISKQASTPCQAAAILLQTATPYGHP
jgi:hypothetical protein